MSAGRIRPACGPMAPRRPARPSLTPTPRPNLLYTHGAIYTQRCRAQPHPLTQNWYCTPQRAPSIYKINIHSIVCGPVVVAGYQHHTRPRRNVAPGAVLGSEPGWPPLLSTRPARNARRGSPKHIVCTHWSRPHAPTTLHTTPINKHKATTTHAWLGKNRHLIN